MASHRLRLDRDMLPKFQSVCECGWTSVVCDHQGAALRFGHEHYREATGHPIPMLGEQRAAGMVAIERAPTERTRKSRLPLCKIRAIVERLWRR